MIPTPARTALRAFIAGLIVIAAASADEPPVSVNIDPSRPLVQAFIARMSAQYGFSSR